MPMLPLALSTKMRGEEVPRVKSPLPQGVVVPMARAPAKVEVAEGEGAEK